MVLQCKPLNVIILGQLVLSLHKPNDKNTRMFLFTTLESMRTVECDHIKWHPLYNECNVLPHFEEGIYDVSSGLNQINVIALVTRIKTVLHSQDNSMNNDSTAKSKLNWNVFENARTQTHILVVVL